MMPAEIGSIVVVVLVGLLLIVGVKRGVSCAGCLLNILIGLILIAAGLYLLGIGGYVNIG